MTKAELLNKVTLNERELQVFGGKVIIRDLTVKEMMEVSELEGNDAMFKMISSAMVKPKMTTKELEAFSGLYVDDLTKIVEAVTPSETK